jgi:nitronate monooxygenase
MGYGCRAKLVGVNGILMLRRRTSMVHASLERVARAASRRHMTALSAASQQLLHDTGATVPVICGPMYPGSNPELVAAVSDAGGFGVVQPISLTKLYGHDFREGLQLIKRLTDKPFGVNFTIVNNKRYLRQMGARARQLPRLALPAARVLDWLFPSSPRPPLRADRPAHPFSTPLPPIFLRADEWMDIAIDEGVKFFLTSLGKPDAIVRVAEKHGVVVYHDVHTPAVAQKAADAGVHGLNCLNSSMGGQTGNRDAETFANELVTLGLDRLPLVQAGGVGDESDLEAALSLGYAGAQLGTRFLATHEANVTDAYKAAICAASPDDIVWTNKLAGTNSSVIRTAQIEAGGLRVGPITSWLLRNSYTKTLVRTAMLIRVMERYKQAAFDESCELWQAGKGVGKITAVESCADVVAKFGTVARA